MKANEFAKEFGIDKTKCIIKDFENGKYKSCCLDSGLINNLEKSWWDVCVYDLKRLVESHELVECCHGIDEAKELLEEIQSEKWCYNLLTNTCVASAYAPSDELSIHYKDLKQAIADVESCYD